jgi:hypothetical protein
VIGTLRAALLRVLRSHSDLLLFQVGNWLSGQILFAVFGAFSPHGALVHIAFVETASAFFGTTFATIAFRIGFNSAAKARALVAARVIILFAMVIAAVSGLIEWNWVIGTAPSLLTPAHFPVVFGAKQRSVVLLVGTRLLACVACVCFALSPSAAFAIYFAPGIAYAFALHVFHFDDWARQSAGPALGRKLGTASSSLDVFLLLPVASAGLFFMQASLVSYVAAASPTLAVIERLVRSGYSLVYPYLMRIARFDQILQRVVALSAFAVPVVATMLSMAPQVIIAMCVPVTIDLVTTNLFRLSQQRVRVLAAWVVVCLVLWSQMAVLR